jgi:hypothetical protein
LFRTDKRKRKIAQRAIAVNIILVVENGVRLFLYVFQRQNIISTKIQVFRKLKIDMIYKKAIDKKKTIVLSPK